VPRHTEQTYNCDPLADLARQLLYAPPQRRIEQVRRAEGLHDLLEEDGSYPLDFFVYRITGYHAESDGDTLLIGQAAQPDLRLMIDQLTRSVNMPAAPDDPVVTADDLAKELNVSTKTLSRWRKVGLRWRWMVLPGDPRRRVVYPREAVDMFLNKQGKRVDQAAAFTQIDPNMKQRLLDRARRIVEARDVTLNRVARHLSRKTGRSLEAMRQMLQQHDRDHDNAPIFVDRTGPLTFRQKRIIARAYRMGVSTRLLCQRFNRTRSTIYRAVRDHRAAAIRRLRLAYHTSPTFEREDADAVILRPESSPDYRPAAQDVSISAKATSDEVMSLSAQRAVSNRFVDDLPEELRPLYRKPMLDETRQLAMFVRLNYLKYRIDVSRQALDDYEPRAGDMDDIESMLRDAKRVRDRLVEGNLPTVLSVARQQLVGVPDASSVHLTAMLEAGNQAMIQAVDQFNPFQGQTFLRYVVWLLSRLFAQLSPQRTSDESDTKRAKRRASATPREAGATVLQRIRQRAEQLGVDLDDDEPSQR